MRNMISIKATSPALDFGQDDSQIGHAQKVSAPIRRTLGGVCRTEAVYRLEEELMKIWTKPAVREQEVGLEVTSYLPAEIDLI